jgi:hypothetical protein
MDTLIFLLIINGSKLWPLFWALFKKQNGKRNRILLPFSKSR